MSETQNYFYLRLKENFFDSDSMILLENMKDGYIYANILLKLYLRSLKNGGRLMLNDTIPYNPEMLASVTRHSVGDIEKALRIFKDLNLIEILDTGAIYITDIQSFIGKSTTEADRKRKYREIIELEKKAPIMLNGTNVQTNVQTNVGQMSDKYPPYKSREELEIELEKELDIKKDIPKNRIEEYTENEKLRNTLNEFLAMRKKIKSEMTDYALKLMLEKLDGLSGGSDILKVKILNQSIESSWKGIFALKEVGNDGKRNTATDTSEIPDKYKNFYR